MPRSRRKFVPSAKDEYGPNAGTQYMKDRPSLLKPTPPIRRTILGGGQHLLSPERRFDSLIVNTPALFVEP